ncbi:hypothetical protein QAD02_019496 [Eretmocerus hayati]|uniref:Uncharacterized protein n=1 Tax=Eretmocerus hayati TaxID=131215 RepID=A0ACC2PM97_9HYME|nr:hypothetical protein QAD02_019496 [Eretmocerus hayati]
MDHEGYRRSRLEVLKSYSRLALGFWALGEGSQLRVLPPPTASTITTRKRRKHQILHTSPPNFNIIKPRRHLGYRQPLKINSSARNELSRYIRSLAGRMRR